MDQRQSVRGFVAWARTALGAVVGAWVVVATSCQVPQIPEEFLPSIEGPIEAPTGPIYQTVSRQDVVHTARRYASHLWTPTEKNVWHGLDPEGVHVDTPDVSFKERGIRPGWWQVGVENQGIPYQWGGFSSIAEFEQGLEQGLAAGDILTSTKRGLLNRGMLTVSRSAVGIGSSGFVSRCWGLQRNHSTRELAGICDVLDSYDALEPGDILNLRDVHVILFEQFADERGKTLLGYEAGAPPSWKVLYDLLPVSHLQRLGYRPMRYRFIVGAPDDAQVLGLNAAGSQKPVTEDTVEQEEASVEDLGVADEAPLL